jgi:hypothetical protein
MRYTALPAATEEAKKDAGSGPPRVEDLAPYLSLRLLLIDGADKNWTDALVDLTQGVEALLTCVFSSQEKKQITRIDGRFLPCGSDRSSEYLAATDPALLSSLKRERTGWMAGCVLPVHTKPAWLRRTSTNGLLNTIHHLLSVAILPPFVAVSATRENLAIDLVALLEDESALADRLPQNLTPIPTETLDKTFVRGEAFNIWLEGLHRPTVFKADKQTMKGPDLRRALDPIGHRTFAYSSVRSRLQAKLPGKFKQATVGYSKTSGVLWLGTTTDMHDYLRQLGTLGDLTLEMMARERAGKKIPIEEEEASRLGFRLLSQEIDPDRLFEATEPFEVELDLGETAELFGESDRAAAIAEWRTNGQFQVAPRPMEQRLTATHQRELVIRVQALWDGQIFREFDLIVHPSIDRKLHVATEHFQNYPASQGDFLEALQTFDALDAELGPQAFVVRFDSGHVLNRERLYLPVPPDSPFTHWQWVDLDEGKSPYDVTKEKPANWSVMRSHRNFANVQAASADDLFSFVVENISRLADLKASPEWFVLCHDQPQEVADFVVLAPQERFLAHIHVKGAKTKDPARRVSIGAYDLVVTQAIKNLPRLDVPTLLAALEKPSNSDREAGQFVVCGSQGTVSKSMDCTPFMEALRKMTKRPLLKKRVIIFQPHIRASYWLPKVDEWKMSSTPFSVAGIQPVFMLSSLLLDATIACMRLSAEFSVWGAWDLPSSKGVPPSGWCSPFLD